MRMYAPVFLSPLFPRPPASFTAVQKQKHRTPVTKPMQMAAIAPTDPEAGVMPPKPAMAPDIMPKLEGRL